MTDSDDVTMLERALVRAARAFGRLDLPAQAAGAPLGKEAYWMLVRVDSQNRSSGFGELLVGFGYRL